MVQNYSAIQYANVASIYRKTLKEVNMASRKHSPSIQFEFILCSYQFKN